MSPEMDTNPEAGISAGRASEPVHPAQAPDGRLEAAVRDDSVRWVCDCAPPRPAVLLARYGPSGRIEIKVRDRHYIAHDRLQATCPRCGARHTLDIRRPPASPTPDASETPGTPPAPAS